MKAAQQCITDNCTNTAAFTTRTKPAWCGDCLTVILNELKMDAVTEFPGKDKRWRTRCQDCQAECDYKLSYLLDLRTRDEPPCRRCFWIRWTVEGTLKYGRVLTPVSKEQVAERLESREYEPVEALVDLPDGGWPVITRCQRCGVQGAHRIGDLSCSCRTNAAPRTSRTVNARGEKNLFVDSGSPAIAWWDHELNEPNVLATLTTQARAQCWWKCPSCGHQFAHAMWWMSRTPECPECDKRRSANWKEKWARLKVTPVADVPELAAAWSDAADPRLVMVASHQPRKFTCANGHRPRVTPSAYLEGGCGFCRRRPASAPLPFTLAEELPEIASQWHPTLNGKWTPETVGPDSKRMVHWIAGCCGHEWSTPVHARNKRERLRCPRCMTILDSLAWSDPGLAAEWDPANPTTPWHVRPHGTTAFTPRWICSIDRAHQWQATLTSRSNGSECPECRQAGKSRVELQHLDAAKKAFADVKSGPYVRSNAFKTRRRWSVDILIQDGERTIAVEYDGAYWHSPKAKMEVDRRKSLDLLAAGYSVVRLREDNLPSLDIHSPDYLELQVYSVAPRPAETISRIAAWHASTAK
ncbi:zinc-ribbon domain-containing protein [Arthrobacter sp. MDT1-65]